MAGPRLRPRGSAPPPPREPAAQPDEAAAAAERRRRAVRAAERAREVEDSPRVLRDKCRQLARALRNAKHLVVYTGAGISTAADIPDYRGPHGVWTRLRRGEAAPRVDAARATPTFTHMALAALCARGTLKFLVSQNCDGLHVRAGTPRRALAELHGDMFAERCAACRAVYLRAFDTTERTARHRHGTRRLCHECGAELADTIVHFGERGRAAWPLNWAGALRHAARADVVLCLGSSLKVLRRYPRLWRMRSPPHARPDLYIVNLQWTPKDSVAALKINARCDDVMRAVARRLRLRVPRYRPACDPLLAHAEPLAPPELHTTRRPRLPSAPPPPATPRDADLEELGSPSASDSDEELPLRRLADRLRPPPPPPALRAFRVPLAGGEATVLLRAEHAPEAPPGPARALTAELRRVRLPKRSVPIAPPSPPGPSDLDEYDSKLRRLLERDPDTDLESRNPENRIGPEPRRFVDPTTTTPKTICGVESSLELECALEPPDRETKPKLDGDPMNDNGRSPKREFSTNSQWEIKCKTEIKTERVEKSDLESKLQQVVKSEWEMKTEMRADWEAKSEVRVEWESEREPWERTASPDARSDASGGSEGGSGALAAAIIARAVLLCRAQLYPGLHTIAPAAAAEALAECAWCLRVHGARRCLWYGPARLTPLTARAWRRVRGRRYLCACCGDGAPADGADTGGWYGKGYRKGRRRRR